jgi:DNA replication protein DnaC
MVDCDLLIIDEIGVQFGTDTERMIIYDILDQRYEAMLPVILTTNVMDLKSLETYLGDKIIDRLYEGDSRIYRFDWHSYRKFQRGG